jgi:predicted acyltransferase
LTAALLAAGIWIAGPLGVNTTAYTIGVALVLIALYWAASAMNAGGAAAHWLALLGRYSLVGYILQIVLIQLLLRAMGGQRLPIGLELAAIGIATLTAVVATCRLLEWMRSRSRGVDGAYRFVFS